MTQFETLLTRLQRALTQDQANEAATAFEQYIALEHERVKQETIVFGEACQILIRANPGTTSDILAQAVKTSSALEPPSRYGLNAANQVPPPTNTHSFVSDQVHVVTADGGHIKGYFDHAQMQWFTIDAHTGHQNQQHADTIRFWYFTSYQHPQ